VTNPLFRIVLEYLEMNAKKYLRWAGYIIVILMLLLVTRQITFAQTPPPPAPVDPQVQSEINAEGETTFWVYLSQQADLSQAYAIQDWDARGQFVVEQLRSVADASQADLRSLLQKRGASFTPFWIVNAIRVTGDAALLAELSTQPGVKEITASSTFDLPDPLPGAPQQAVNSVEWNIDRINAPQVWSTFGVRGEGIVVANIDTGVQYDHPALSAQYRGNLGGGSYDHSYNWYDPTGLCSPGTPCDNIGHGSHTMGTMVGDDLSGNQIGVAPGARWIAAKGCEYDWCSDYALLQSAQWILAPCPQGVGPGDPACDPARRPQIVNNSWGGWGGNAWYQASVQAWVASGIFPAFSIGNSGTGCGTAGSPGDYPESYAAGAFDINNTIAWFSSRGPSAFGGIVKPNLAAPGVDVRSSVPANDYAWYSGTSMASPHVAGTVALMWSAAPVLFGDVAATRLILDQTAFDVIDMQCGPYPAPGEEGNPNNVWGEGRLDAFLAVDQSPRGPTGSLQGTVFDAATSQPVADATVQVAGPSNRTTRTDTTGFYQLLLPVGSYDVTVSKFAYLTQTATGVVVSEGAVTVQDFALVPAPAYSVSGYILDDQGNPVANATVTVLNTPIAPATTDASGFYLFSGVPEGTYEVRAEAGRCNDPLVQSLTVSGEVADFNFTLPARRDAFGYHCRVEPFNFIEASQDTGMYGDDNATQVDLPFAFPFYGQTYSTAYVSTNGLLNFLEWGSFLGSGSIPSPWSPNAAIYPFWDDLYVDWNGDTSVRTELIGEAPNRQFVIEWRNVAFCCISAERVRFEVILYENGEILTQYTSIDENNREKGGSATLGIENETGEIALQYSYDEPAITEGLAVRYLPPPMGRLQGTITDASTGAPIAGARLDYVGPSNGTVVADENGFYRILLQTGHYTIAAYYYGYIDPPPVEVDILEDATTVQDFALQPLPRYSISGYVRDERGDPVPNAKLWFPYEPIWPMPVAYTDESGYYLLDSVPMGIYTIRAEAGGCYDSSEQPVALNDNLTLDFTLPQTVDAFGYTCRPVAFNYVEADTVLDIGYDYPTVQQVDWPDGFFTFYGELYDVTWVSSSGFLNVLEAVGNPWNEPLPNPWLPNGAVYPFWDDLVVDRYGWWGPASSVRTALIGEWPEQAYVIEWRDLATCWGCSERVSFEALLYSNGDILMQYRDIDENRKEQGDEATVGIEDPSGSIALQYSYNEPVLRSGLAVLYTPPPAGHLRVRVTDAIDGQLIQGVSVRFYQDGNLVREGVTNVNGVYRWIAPLGTYTIEATAQNYATETATVVVDGDDVIYRQDFYMRSAHAQVSPASLVFLAPQNQTFTQKLNIQNAGLIDLTYSIGELAAPLTSGFGSVTPETGVTTRSQPAGYTPTAVNASITSGGPVLVFMDYYPWGSDALLQLLNANQITYDLANSSQMGSIDLSAYEVVFISSDQPQYFYDNYNANTTRFAEYVEMGGFLWVGAAAWGWNGGSFQGGQLPGGVTVWPNFESYNDVEDNLHPVVQGVDDPFWGTDASHAYFQNLPDDVTVIADGYYTGLPTLIEYDYYAGKVLAFGQTLEYSYMYGYAGGRILSNSVPYAYDFEPVIDIPWLSEEPTSGTVPPGSAQQVNVLVNTTGMQPGVYQARLRIVTNDPKNRRIIVPVTLIVPAYFQAVNAADSQYIDLSGYTWSADKQWVSGSWGFVNKSQTFSTKKAISGTDDDRLYQTQRSNVLEYRFDGLPPGIYQVDLRFAEISNTQPNKRVFDVLLEGNIVIYAHDVALEVGSFAADNHTFYVLVTDGQLNIRFVPRRSYGVPMINAIAVINRPDMTP
jgi:subtilisin family serine protease